MANRYFDAFTATKHKIFAINIEADTRSRTLTDSCRAKQDSIGDSRTLCNNYIIGGVDVS